MLRRQSLHDIAEGDLPGPSSALASREAIRKAAEEKRKMAAKRANVPDSGIEASADVPMDVEPQALYPSRICITCSNI